MELIVVVLIALVWLANDANRPAIEAALLRAEIVEHDLKFLRARGWPL